MPEGDPHILDRGFKNVSQDGKITGFQLAIRTGYYRGVYLSLLEDFALTVDGESFRREQISFTTGGRVYTLDELANETEARWPYEKPATLIVSKPGGLKPGMHDVLVAQKVRASYMPPSRRAFVFTYRKQIALVQ